MITIIPIVLWETFTGNSIVDIIWDKIVIIKKNKQEAKMNKQNELMLFYQNNEDFKRYIDECVKTYGEDVNYMLKTKMAESYYQYLKEEMENKENENK